MRLLLWHVNSFRSVVTERGRSEIADPKPEHPVEIGEGLLVFASVERADEADPPAIAARAASEIARLARQLKVKAIVLHSFAHLFAKLSAPAVAVEVLQLIRDDLTRRGFAVQETPFGWFNTLEISAKGHPISRVARTIALE